MATNLARETDLKLDTVDLPVEILEYILQLATAVPDPPVRPNRVRIEDGGYELSEGAARRYWEAMAVKRTVARVSRQWRALAISALYEHVAILSLKALEAMVRIVGAPPALVDSERTVGSYVKRLDLLVNGLYWVDRVSNGAAESTAVRLCRALPNLLSLTFKSSDANLHSLKSLPFSDIISGHLEYFDSQCSFPIPTIEMVKFLATHPRLVSCDFPFTDPIKDTDIHVERLRSTGVTFPALQELFVQYTGSRGLDLLERVPGDMVPNLTKLVFVYHEQPDDTAVRNILSKYGCNLTSLDIRIEGECPEDDLPGWFSLFQEHCPKLREFCLSTNAVGTFDRYSGNGPSLPTYPAIKTFGVHHIVSDPEVELGAESGGWPGWKDFWRDVEQRALCFPKLGTLRLMDEENLRGLASPACRIQFEEGLRRYREKGVDVVDFLGQCLNRF